jgi:cobalt/nickel transport system permease protein
MADALLSPVVSGCLTVTAATMASFAYRKVSKNIEDTKIPLMGVMGAFVFAAQMINFSIPGTGSSGHIGGGMLLAILLGPYAGFLTISAVLLIQALFFGDGGLMALGANIFNMGFFTCFIAYPLIYKPLINRWQNKYAKRLVTVFAVVIGLQMGAFSVVLETLLSGKTELPFTSFVLLMQPIHLAIGIVEGLITAAVLAFVVNDRPELLRGTMHSSPSRAVLVAMLMLTLITGGALSLYASSHPDGLEWSIEKVTGQSELETDGSGIFGFFASVQEKTAILPDYDFKTAEDGNLNKIRIDGEVSGTSLSGIVGSVMTLLLIVGVTAFIRKTKKA